MKLEENNTLSFPNIRNPIIYFLLDEDEVVYVGQSKIGLSRPYMHKDKKFTDVAVMECEESELDKKETELIKRYKPKYNKKAGNSDYSFRRAIRIIKKKTSIHNFNIYDLRRLIKKFGIETYIFLDSQYMDEKDFEKIFSFVKETSNNTINKQVWKRKVFS